MVDQHQEGDRTFDSSDIKNTLDETKKISATQGETDETLDGIENNEDLTSTTILPKLILRNGHFIESESSSQKLLWVPVSDSSYTSTFFGLFKTISNSFPFSMLYHQRSNGRMMENVQSSPRNDIESQEPPPPLEHSFVNTDGIYKPLNQTRINHKYHRHNIRSLSRLKRDGIQVNNENNGPQQCIEPKLKWIRPQDVQPSDLASQKENYIDEATARKISKQESNFSYALEVYIERIKFHSHPLIIEEEKLIQNIEVLLSKFRSLNNRAVMHNFEIRLGVIIKEITELKSRHTEQKSVITEIPEEQTCLVLYNNFLDLTSKIAELELETYSLYSTILKKWDNVTRIRKGQGFQSTSQSLVKLSNESSINDESMTEQIQNFRDTLEWFAKTVEGYSKSLESEYVAQSLHSAVETLSVIHSAKKFRMDISLNIDDNRTFSLSDNVIENRRRDKIRSEVYFAKLLIDGQVVETTSTRALEWPSLDIKLDDIFEVILDKYTDNVAIQIYLRRFGLIDKLISTTYVTVPGERSDFNHLSLELLSPSIDWYQFSETAQQNVNSHQNRVDGSMLIQTQWRRVQNPSNTSHLPDDFVIKPMSSYTIIRHQEIESNPHKAKMLDDGELSDNSLANMKPSIRAALNEQSMRFTLAGTNHSFFNYNLLKEPVRHQLIKQRNRKQFFNQDDNPIPLEECYVDTEATQLATGVRLRSRMEHELIETASQERPIVDPKNIKHFVKQLRKLEKVMEKWQRNPPQRGVEDIVHDASLIRARSPPKDMTWIFDKIFPPRKRSLFPNLVKKEADASTSLAALQNPCLRINLIGANNMQMRKGQPPMNNQSFLISPPSIRRLSSELPFLSSPKPDSFVYKLDDFDSAKPKNKSITSFVRVRFKEKNVYSRTESGNYPLWEQVLEIPLFPEMIQTMTPLKLQEVEDDIEITLFDRVELDFRKGGGYYNDENTLTVENRFMGFVKIPFTEMHHEGKFHGHYILNTPEVLIGYEPGNIETNLDELITHQVTSDNDGSDLESQKNIEQLKETQILTSLHMSLSIEPKFGCDSKHSYIDNFASNERPSTVRYIREWMNDYKNYNSSCKERHFNIMVPGINGKTWLLNRFLNSQAPPQSCRSSMHQCANFVSLIPSLDNWSSFKCFKQLDDVWLPSQTCLDILAGNWSGHAVLLANYFMFLSDENPELYDMDVYLAIGTCAIDNRAVYVITKSTISGSVTLWNPITGKSYPCNDEKCPQINIGILVSSNNIYANLQTAIHPSLLSFEVNRVSRSSPFAWKQFYVDESITKASNHISFYPIQDLDVHYTAPNESKANELEVELLDQVKTSIRGWRRTPCTFNSDIGNRLRQFLEELEENKRNGTSKKSSRDYWSSLSSMHVCRGKDIYGFPLHFSFSNVKEILERVEMTGIHQRGHPDVEFAAAVKIFPYECSALSVWVFLCTISPDHYI